MLQAPQGDDREAGRLAAAFMAAPHPLALIETEAGRSSLRVCNTAWERLTGYASADIAGKDLRALGLDLAWPHVGIAAADPIHAPATLRLADDRILSCWITAAPLPQETKDSYAVVAGFTAAAAEREVHIRAGGLAQSHLLAMIGHDLRQPLQTIVAALQLLGSAPPARAQQLLGYANAAATQLDQDLAAVAFLSAQQRGSALFLEEIALQPLLDEVMAAWIPQADLKSIKLRTVSTEARVTSHPQLLRSIVSNLVANAVKHTARGGVLIGVRRRGDDLAISVYDTGPGILPPMRARLFEAFARGDDAAAGGLGLGLWIVGELAGVLGCTIGVNTALGRGSCFSVRMSAHRPLAAALGSSGAQAESERRT